MIGGQKFLKWLIPLVAILHRVAYPNSASAACDFSFLDGNRIYNYTLTSPVRDFPHGICSEDGYYEVAANETILWFQLCDGMIFNHDPPTCADCWLGLWRATRCGRDCTALVANKIGGYHVCTTIGRGPKINIDIFGYRAETSIWMCRYFKCSWERVGVVCHLNNHCLVPFWSISTVWHSLSAFLPWDSWYRCYPQFGLLVNLAPKNPGFLCFFGEEVQGTFSRLQQLIFSCELLRVTFFYSGFITDHRVYIR